MKGLFNKATTRRHQEENSILREISGKDLEQYKLGASSDVWMSDPIGTGLKNTQQLKVDWADYSKHVFFNSAEAKVNLAFDQIINGYPFDGTSDEKQQFHAQIGGFTNYILNNIESHKGYLTFNGTSQYIEFTDQTGKLIPELSKSPGQTVVTKNFHEKGVTFEAWVRIPSPSSNADSMVIMQKLKSATEPEGFSIWTDPITTSATTYNLNFMISSDNHKAIKHSIVPIPLEKKVGLEIGKWHHVAFTYHRGTTEKISAYVDGKLYSNTGSIQAELEDILLGNVNIKIGHGISHVTHANSSGYTPDYFAGSLDEVRLWLGVRSAKDINLNYLRNVDAEDSLLLYYRFNEPPSDVNSYDAKTVVLDSSGNSFHATITGYTNSCRTINGSYPVPLSLERPIDNVILFPDWAPTLAYNQSLLVGANHYDRNNPNLITKLIPPHYFEEAQFFEGIEEHMETPKELEYKRVQYPVAGHSKQPSRTIILTFLLVWANFFDDIKIFLDSVSSLDKVSYDDFDQIPPQMINFLSEYYGINLPNPFANEDPEKWQSGANLTNEGGLQTPLSKTIDSMWRRILINLPFLLRSRGTIQGIKSLMNTIGIQADSTFRFREFGGSLSSKISTVRKRKKKRTGCLNFSKLNYMKTGTLWAYRHEPGLPDTSSAASPTAASTIFSSGDITLIKPGSGAPKTLFTSGSWSWEGRYQLLPTETTASLFRIERNNGSSIDTLVNLVAMRAADGAGVDYNLRLFIDGYKSSSDAKYLDITGINLWDGKPRYISITNEWGASENTLELRVMKSTDSYILEHHSGSISYTKPGAAKVGNVNNSGLPLFEIDQSTTAGENMFITIGDDSPTRGTTWNQGTTAKHFNYNGNLSHMRFWTKKVDRKMALEHAQNPFSVSVSNPVNSFTFPGETFNEMSGAQYMGTLPENSWERLRMSYDMLQENMTFSSSTLDLIDTTQTNRNATLNGSDGGFFRTDILYSITNPDFDIDSTTNKVRVRSYLDKETAEDLQVHHGSLTKLGLEVGRDDRRFSIESSLVHALNEDIVNVLGNSNILNNYLGAPELEYAVEYPELKKISDIYFKRLVDKVNYSAIIEFQRWFNNNFAALIEDFIPYTADFLGINFVVESHFLERHKMEYKQGDVHVDIYDRMAFSQEALIIGTLRAEIT